MVFAKARIEAGLALVERVSFWTSQCFGVHVNRVVSDFDLSVGMGFEVVVPVRVILGAVVRRENKVALIVFEIHDRVDARLATLRSRVVE